MKIKYLLLIFSVAFFLYAIFLTFENGFISSYGLFMISFALFFLFKLK